MQKISSYLYPNRINIVADLELFPVRWNIVYQNRIKIYQGVDNVLTVDVKNTDQKRIDITDMDLRMVITDTHGLEVTDVALTPKTTTGLATVTISEQDLENVDPQFLEFSIYRINEDLTKTVFYADTQFGAKGKMELLGSIMGQATPARQITRFIKITDPAVLGLPPYEVRLYSDAVDITQPNFLASADSDQVNFDFKFLNLEGQVTVQFTKDSVVSAGSEWVTIETFDVASTTATLTKSYTNLNGYSRELRWARVYYTRANDNIGSIDKVIVTL